MTTARRRQTAAVRPAQDDRSGALPIPHVTAPPARALLTCGVEALEQPARACCAAARSRRRPCTIILFYFFSGLRQRAGLQMASLRSAMPRGALVTHGGS
jgi:hypothetical protein